MHCFVHLKVTDRRVLVADGRIIHAVVAHICPRKYRDWHRDFSDPRQISVASRNVNGHTFWQAVPAIPVELGLTVAAEASAIIGAEGIWGALAVVILTRFHIGSAVCEY